MALLKAGVDSIRRMCYAVGMDDLRSEWNECAVLCKFLSEHDGELSKDTRILLYQRLLEIIDGIIALADGVIALDNSSKTL